MAREDDEVEWFTYVDEYTVLILILSLLAGLMSFEADDWLVDSKVPKTAYYSLDEQWSSQYDVAG